MRNLLFYTVTVTILLVNISTSCSSELTNNSKVSHLADESSSLWLQYADSSNFFKIKTSYVDSMVLYFLRPDAPSVIGDTYLALWKNGKELVIEDFFNNVDAYAQLKNNHFIFTCLRNKTLVVQEINFNQEIKTTRNKVLDLTKTSCKEISTSSLLESENNEISVEVQINDTCFGTQTDTIIQYKPLL